MQYRRQPIRLAGYGSEAFGVGEIFVRQGEIVAGLKHFCVSTVGDQEDAAVAESQHVLPQHTVEQKRICFLADPDLVAVVEQIRNGAGICLLGGGTGDPFRREDLLSVPAAVLHNQLADFGHILGEHIESPAALIDAHGAFFPVVVVDAQRIKQSGLQIFAERQFRFLFYNGGKDIGVQAVIKEVAGDKST